LSRIADALSILLHGRINWVRVSGADPQIEALSLAQLYEKQPNLQTVVSYIADNIAQLPIKCYQRKSETDRERLRNSPAALAFSHPNNHMTSYELKRAIVSDLCIYGRAYLLALADESMPSGYQLLQLPPTWITGYHGTSSFAPESIDVFPPNGAYQVRIPSDFFVIFHNYNPSLPDQGASPVAALRATLTEQIESDRYRTQVWHRGGRVNTYVTRPKDVRPFTPEQRDKWMASFHDAWAGDKAANAGGTLLLEDGMEIKSFAFNARDAQWAQAKKFSREDVSGIYHLKPQMIWPNEGSTYASEKENSRALYNDTLGPIIAQITERANQFLLPILGEPEGDYIEFDMSAKIKGSFEEQATVLQTATGGPYMTRNEARAQLNLPSIDGGDDLIVPMNVTLGGQASPTDSNPLKPRNGTVKPQQISGKDASSLSEEKSARRKARGHPTKENSDELSRVLQKFFARQARSVLPQIGAKKDAEGQTWWDADRWDQELADDLSPVIYAQSELAAKKAIQQLGLDPSLYDVGRTQAYLRKIAEGRAHGINGITLEELKAALAGSVDPSALGSTPHGVFEKAQAERSDNSGSSIATSVAGWSVLEAVHQTAPDRGVTKTWIHNPSSNPRSSHARMDGETVPYNKPFSNGAMWPGDTGALDASEIAHCHCEVEVTMP
jgi:HK97 family phage portal protein